MSGMTDGKVALVTGGGSGIGRAAATCFAAEGASVVVVDRDRTGGEETVEAIEAAGGDGTFVEADVTDETQVEAMVSTAVEAYGRLDCAFNNAGVNDDVTGFTDVTLEAWDRMLAVDLTSVFLCMKHELRQMVDQGQGAIVNTASGAGLAAAPGLPHYTAAKHGVVGLTKCGAQEYASAGIRVNAICPGTTDTPMIRRFIDDNPGMESILRHTVPQGTFGEPDAVAAAAVWLCSDHASWVSGVSMVVDGGMMAR